jgi:hypothetical protein
MNRLPIAPYFLGALGGLVVALAFFVFFGSLTAIETVTIDNVATFTATTSYMGLLTFILGAVGGVVLAAVAFVTGRARDPQGPRFAFGWLAIVGIVLGGSTAFAVVSLGVTVAGERVSGTVMMPVTAMVVAVAVAGVIGGAITTPVVDALARPATFGAQNAATPVTSAAFWSDMGRAIGVPVLAIAIGALLAIGLAEILLNADSAAVSVAIFAAVGAVILGGTALLAIRPWSRSGNQEQ